jgi:hypothetical protein
MKLEIKRIGLFSAIKTMFVLGGVGGFLLGIIQWMFLAMIQRAGEALPGGLYGLDQPGVSELLDAGIGALGLILPFFGGFAGAVAGVFFATILGGVYNLAARMWGGLELETADVQMSERMTVPVSRPTAPGEATPLPRSGSLPPVITPDTRPESERRPPAMYE